MDESINIISVSSDLRGDNLCINPCSEDEKMFEELKQRISEDIVEGAEQQAANLLGSVEKEKVGLGAILTAYFS